MPNEIAQILTHRGMLADIPLLGDGEQYFAKDQKQLWIGQAAGGNYLLMDPSFRGTSTGGGGSTVTPPVINAFVPAAGNLTSIPSSLTVVFNNSMNQGLTGAGIGNPSNWTLAASAGSISANPTSIDVTATTATLHFTASGQASGDTFTATASASINDAAGNALTGGRVWTSTYLPAATNPTIVSWSPAAGNFASLPSTFQVVFSQAMDATTTQNTANWTFTAGGVAVSFTVSLNTGGSSTIATLTPTWGTVAANAAIVITASTNIKSSVGALSVTGARVNNYTYTPVVGPTVSSFSPFGSNIASIPQTVVVNFSKAMNTGTTGGGIANPSNYSVAASSGSASISGIGSVTSTSCALSITGSAIPSGGTITITALTSLMAADGSALSAAAQDILTYTPGALVLQTPATPVANAQNNFVARGQGGGGATGSISFSPYNALHFIGSDGGSIFRSADGGSSWWSISQAQVIYDNGFGSGGVEATCPIGFSPDGNTLFLSRGSLAGVSPKLPKKSVDQGVTWATMTGLTLTGGETIQYFACDSYNDQVVLCGTSAHLYVSVDKGTTWTAVASAAGAAKGTFIDYTSPTVRTIYHAIAGSILKATWTISSGAAGMSFGSFYTATATGIRVFTGGRDGSGLTLAYVDTDATAAAAQSPARNFSSNFGYIWTSPGTSTFSRNTQGGGKHLGMAENDSQTIYTTGGTGDSSGYDVAIWVTRNAGVAWTLRMLQYKTSGSPFQPWPSDKWELTAAGLDIGNFDGTYYSFSVNKRNSAQAGASANFFFLRTDDYGVHWKSPETQNDAYPNAVMTLTASFTMPAAGSTVTVAVDSSSPAAGNEYLFVEAAGHFQVSSIPDSTHLVLMPCSDHTFTGTTTSGSNEITSPSSLAGLMPGLQVSGTGIPAACVIASVTPKLKMSAPATASGTVTITQSGYKNYAVNATASSTIPSGGLVKPARLVRSSWNSTGMEVTSILRFKFHPTNPQVCYAACSDVGGLMSADGGVTYTPVNTSYNTSYDYAFDPADSTKVWVACGNAHDWPDNGGVNNNTGATGGGVFVSSDRGISWAQVGSGTLGYQCLALAYDATNGYLYAGTQGHGVYKSTNGGTTWATHNTGLPTTWSNIVPQIEVDSSNGDVYCLVGGNIGETNGQASFANQAVTGVYYKTAAGSSWTLLRGTVSGGTTGTVTNPWYSPICFAIDYSTRSTGIPQTIWLADEEENGNWLSSGIWKTTDRSTWTRMQQHTHPRNITVDSTNSRVYLSGRLVMDGSWGKGGMMVSTNGTTFSAPDTRIPLQGNGNCCTLDPNDSTKLFYGIFIGGLLYGPRP